jgi:polyribonucleotide nucleotidyltransferase
VVKPGDQIMVKVMEIDSQGRINLSRKAMLGGDAGGGADGGSGRAPEPEYAARGNGAPPRREPSGSGGGGSGGGADRPRRRRPRPGPGGGSAD